MYINAKYQNFVQTHPIFQIYNDKMQTCMQENIINDNPKIYIYI